MAASDYSLLLPAVKAAIKALPTLPFDVSSARVVKYYGEVIDRFYDPTNTTGNSFSLTTLRSLSSATLTRKIARKVLANFQQRHRVVVDISDDCIFVRG